MKKLKPCPFCGSDNLKLISYNSIAGVCKMVECMQCFAQVPSRATKKEAIEAWNKRQYCPNCEAKMEKE